MGARLTSQQVAKAGQHLVAARLFLAGARAVRFDVHGLRTELVVENDAGREVARVKAKTKRAGTWQPSLTEARHPADERGVPRYWVLVDLADAREPEFFVVPGPWIQNDIRKTHDAAIARHGGRRERTQNSTHHALAGNRVEQWRERWDLVKLL
jgi:hypothetical protein